MNLERDLCVVIINNFSDTYCELKAKRLHTSLLQKLIIGNKTLIFSLLSDIEHEYLMMLNFYFYHTRIFSNFEMKQYEHVNELSTINICNSNCQ